MRLPWFHRFTKGRILKGVLRQNLVILGRAPLRRGGHRLSLSPSLAFAAALAGALMINWGYGDTPAGTPPDAPAPRASAAAAPPGSDRLDRLASPLAPPADYDGLTALGALPIREVLGLGVTTIMIDPGHGGEATGAIGARGTLEKEITLDIALKLREMLRKDTACRILMTRETDVTLPLKDRVALANAGRVDLFVSVHVNSLPSRPMDFIETYYFGPSKDRGTAELAAAENEGSRYAISDYQEVIQEIANQLKFQESHDIASRIQNTLVDSMKRRNKEILDFGVKRAPFMVLLDIDMPGVLVEVACLSNPEEEARLRDPAYRGSIAGYLERGIISYLNDRSRS